MPHHCITRRPTSIYVPNVIQTGKTSRTSLLGCVDVEIPFTDFKPGITGKSRQKGAFDATTHHDRSKKDDSRTTLIWWPGGVTAGAVNFSSSSRVFDHQLGYYEQNDSGQYVYAHALLCLGHQRVRFCTRQRVVWNCYGVGQKNGLFLSADNIVTVSGRHSETFRHITCISVPPVTVTMLSMFKHGGEFFDPPCRYNNVITDHLER